MSLKKATKTDTPNRVELEVEVGAEQFEQAIDKAYRRDVKKMNVPGFRKGKAPRRVIERLYGKEVFYEDAMNIVYPDALDAAIAESGYEFVEDKIDLDVVSVGEEGMVFKAVVTVKPDVTVKDYIGMKAEKPAVEVTDADVDAELTKLQNRQSRLVSVDDRAAADGDTVVIDYEGFVDDKAFAGGKGEHQSLVLGSGQFIPGFEEQIVGKKIDEEFDVNVTFPEEYHAEELKGKPAVFKCKLHEIKTRELPELNDDFAKDCSEFDTLEEMKADIRKKLTEDREREADAAFETALAEQLADKIEADIPQAMFENAIDESVREFDQRLQSQGLSLDMYLQYTGMDMAAFRESNREKAELQVKVRLALETIAKQENLTVSDEDLEAEYDRFAEQYHLKVEQIKAALSEKGLRSDMLTEKAMHFVRDNAKAGKPAAKKSTSTAKKADGETAEKKPAAKKTTSTAKKAEGETAAKKPAAKKTASTAKKADGETSAKKPAAKKTTSTAKKAPAKKAEEK